MARNPFVANFVDDLSSRYPVDGDSMLYSEWVRLNTKLNGRSFGYEGYEFQKAIVDDMHPELVVIKPSQVGMTEVQVRKFLAFLARNRGSRGIFTFPNEKMFKANSRSRIKPIVDQPVFNSSAFDSGKPTRSMEMYEINGSWANITGLTEGDATSTPADILFHDELDLSDQVMIGLFQSRLQNSIFKITQLFSTPTFPGYGIDLAYNASDMREYMVKCACCGRHQVPRFTMPFLHLPGYRGSEKLDDMDQDMVDAIDLTSCYFKCFHCSKPLDLRDPALREWVAERPSRDAHGYRIRPTSSYKLDPAYIIRQLMKMKRLDNLKGWWNTVNGETFNDGNSKLEPEMINKILGQPAVPDVGKDVPCALASDMGKTCHLTVGKIVGDVVHPFLFEAVPNGQIKARIKQLCEKYNIVAGAVDRHPYEITAKEIYEENDKKIFPTEYRGTEFVHLVDNEYEQLDFVQIARTRAIDEVVMLVRNQAMEMAGYTTLKQVVTEHMCDMVRIEHPEKTATWEKTTGQDHFMHSLTLLQASIKIAHIVKLSIKVEPKKTILGLVGVPQKNAPTQSTQSTQLGQIRRREPERLI